MYQKLGVKYSLYACTYVQFIQYIKEPPLVQPLNTIQYYTDTDAIQCSG